MEHVIEEVPKAGYARNPKKVSRKDAKSQRGPDFLFFVTENQGIRY